MPVPPASDPASPDPRLGRGVLVAAALLLAGYAVMAFVTRLPGVSVSNDDAVYVFLARSLLEGGYREIFLPGAPPHVQYPPGWPLLLAGAIAVIGERAEVLLALPLLLSVGGLVLLFDAARRVLPPLAALAALWFAVTNPLVVTYGGRLMAEAAFFFFAMLALWALAHPAPSARRLLLGCAAAIASAFMRSAGVAVIGAVALHFALERRWRWALGFSAAAALTFGPWLAWSFLAPRQLLGRSYAGDLLAIDAEAAARRGVPPLVGRALAVAERLQVYVLGHLHAVMGLRIHAGTLLDNLGWVALLGTAGLAGLAALWARARVLVLFVLALVALLGVWTWTDRRFLHPLVPVLGVVLAGGTWAIARRAGRWGGPVALVLLAVALHPRTVLRTVELVRNGLRCDHDRVAATCYNPVERAFLEASRAGRDLPESAVVLVQREAAFAFHSGRRGVYAWEAITRPPEHFGEFAAQRGVTHVMISRITRNEPVGLAERLVTVCDRLDVLGSFGEGTFLFALRPDPRPGGEACPLVRSLLEESLRIREDRVRNMDVFELPGDRSG